MGGLSQTRQEAKLHSAPSETIIVPSVSSIFGQWPSRCNKNYGALRKAVDERLESLRFDPKKIAKLKAADFTLFACLWWPESGYDDLVVTIYLIIWLFMWDDELDQPSGTLVNDMGRAGQYRRRTIKFVEQSLGLVEHGVRPEDLNTLISDFEPIGQKLRASYSLAQRQRLRDEIVIYVKSTKVEQRARLDGKVWTVQDYLANRAGTSAVGVTSSMIEFVNRTRLPDHVMHSQEMQAIWYETNIIISIVNDILSARKELAQGCADSFLPVACNSGCTLQEAVDLAVLDLQRRIRNFDDNASRLLKQYPETSDPQTHDAIRRFIRASRENCTGNMVWSLLTPRYGLASCPRDSDGNIHIAL